MKSIVKSLPMLLLAALGSIAQAQSHPQRPAESYGMQGARPADAPQRPADSYGQRGSKPADAPTRPADSYGKTGQRPDGVGGQGGRRGGRSR